MSIPIQKFNLGKVKLLWLAGSVALLMLMGTKLVSREGLLPLIRGWKPTRLVNWIASWNQKRFTSRTKTKLTSIPNHTLSILVDEVAFESPQKVFAIIPSHNPDYHGGWQSVTFQNLADAVTYTCCWIEDTIGPSEEAEYIAYIGGNDIRYAILILACMKTGYIPLLLSPRNSDNANRHLMNISSCEKFIYSEERRMVKDRVEKAKPSAKSWMIPTLEQILEAPVSSRIYHSACREHENDICLALHSSGTTGLPKVVNLTNGYLQSTRRLLSIQKPPGRKLALPAAFAGPTLNTAPFFHILGFYAIFESICHGMTFVNYPDGPITEEGVLSALSTSGARCATFPPSALEDLSSSNAFLNEIVKLDVIIYGGAALSSDVGRRLTQRTNVIPVIGSTETGPISSLAPTDRAKWEYFEWNPEYGIDMQSIGDGLYEMVIPRPKARDFHPVFHIYPDISEYRTKDVFSPHPQHPSLWKAEARLDDVIVLSNGEKFNPINMERQIEMDPLVSRALVVGQGSFLPGVILELNWALLGDKDSDDQLIERLWQSVKDANRYAPDYAQLSKSVILVASQDRPFRTTSKGFTERQGTIKEYSADISRLLSKSEDTSLRQNVDWSSDEQVTLQINGMVSNLLSVRELSDEQNLFSLGMDSLQVVRLARMLQSAVQSMYDSEPKPNIGSQDVYAHPTTRQLSTYMQSLRSVSKVDPEEENGQRNQDRSVIIDEFIEKYTQNIFPPSIQRVRPSQIRTVLLTGSTGSLGNYLLYGLSRDPGISKIICLTRDAGAEDRQGRSLKERGLVIRNGVDVQYLVAHESEPNLGLDLDTYRALSETVDIVIHNAWKVNFAEKLDSFEPNIQGVRRIIDFCLESKDNPHLHFISSIESVGDWSVHHSEQLPEDTVLDFRSVPERGYFESKFVAEQICDVAASRSDLSVGIHRVGQLGGPTTKLGHWNTNEWLPSLIKTSKAIGLAPRDLGWLNVDWIPVDTLATILLEIITDHAKQYTSNQPAYFNLANPSTTTWETLLPAVTKAYGVKVVELQEWLDVLDQIQDPSDDDITRMSSLKILDFYHGLQNTSRTRLKPSTEYSRQSSQTMRSLEPITESLMDQWIRQWTF